ncbi:hypothetical protein ACSFA8_26095 [Variovorax sp. RT4R15]|uniref:hypothetical protein n=1 Tax=Variovorax sp. RT4R15 TaxID=3443737 RepID=UPI003F4768B8
MKLIQHLLPLALAGVLAGCAAGPQKRDAHAHSGMGTMDMQAMCEEHKKMISGKPSAEQQAMMREHMKSMTPEMRQRMQTMHEQCK